MTRQILCVTCDNTSNNNVMVNELAKGVSAFGGSATHARCFLHVINLIAKSLTWEFDVKKKNTDQMFKVAETCEEALQMELDELSKGMDEENTVTLELDRLRKEADEYDEDNVDGWIDEVALLMDGERCELEDDILPVKLALVKVC